MAECRMRKTQVTLLDGRVVTLRALPMKREVARSIGEFMSKDGNSFGAFMDLLAVSLRYDQDDEAVAAVLDGDGLPTLEEIAQAIGGGDGPGVALAQAIIGAWVIQFGKA